MSGTAAIVLGLLALPHAFGYSVVYDGHHWHQVSAGFAPEMVHRGQFSDGFDPELIHRHVYNMAEYCAKLGRFMYFGDEVLVVSQRPWDMTYQGGVRCTMNFTGSDEDVGILVSVITSDTPDCDDYLKIERTANNDPKEEMFCGHRTNITGKSENYLNETVLVTWNTIPRDTKKPADGIKVLLTAFQTGCKPRQACFPCRNGFIIDQVHMCNGFNNCGDNSDEKGCPINGVPANYVATSSSYVAISLMLGILCLVAIGALSFTTHRYYKRSLLIPQHLPEGQNLVDRGHNQADQPI